MEERFLLNLFCCDFLLILFILFLVFHDFYGQVLTLFPIDFVASCAQNLVVLDLELFNYSWVFEPLVLAEVEAQPEFAAVLAGLEFGEVGEYGLVVLVDLEGGGVTGF